MPDSASRELTPVDRFGGQSLLRTALNTQYVDILSLRTLEIELPEIPDKPREWSLALTGFDKSERQSLVLNYPRTLAPCT